MRAVLLFIAVAGLLYIAYYIALFLPGEYKRREIKARSDSTETEILLPEEEASSETPSEVAAPQPVETPTSSPTAPPTPTSESFEAALQKRLSARSTDVGSAELSLIQTHRDRVVIVIENFFRDPNLTKANHLLLAKFLLAEASDGAINVLTDQLQNNGETARNAIAEAYLQTSVAPISEESRRLSFSNFIELAADNNNTIFVAAASKLVETLNDDDRRTWFTTAIDTLIRISGDENEQASNPLLTLLNKTIQENDFYKELMRQSADRIPDDAPFKAQLVESAQVPPQDTEETDAGAEDEETTGEEAEPVEEPLEQ